MRLPITISCAALGVVAISLGVIEALAGTDSPPKQTMVAQGMGGRQAMMQRFWGNRLPQGIDPSLLPAPDSAGARLLAAYCTQCHGLPGPGLHTATEWPQVLERMDMRMRTMGGGMMGGGMMGRGMMGGGMMGVAIPTTSEWDTLLAYLEQYAQRPMDAAHYPDLNTPAGKAISTFCTQCHAMPDPHQHNAKDWPAVVGRMRSYMGPMGKALPDETTTRQIIGFLQRHSETEK